MQPEKKPYSSVEGLKSRFVELYGEVTDEQIKRYNDTFENFKKYFGVEQAYVASSSGRVEVCGNHTDHNGGRVVSCAISLDTLAMFLPTDDNVIVVKSEGYPEMTIDLNGPEIEKKGTSPALIRGVCVGLKNKGFNVGGFKMYCTSNVLGGAGISSSASFEVLMAEVLNFLYNEDKISDEDKSKVAQFSEREYFGKPCGLLDQTAIAFGGLKKLDFADKNKIVVEDTHNNLADYTLVLVNTGGSHADLVEDYASIPREMFSVANALGVERLIDISEKDFYEKLPSVYNKVADRAVSRAIHFFDENNRVDQVANALKSNDYQAFLDAINGSGISSLCFLQNCYVAGSDEQLIPKALAVSKKYLNGGANRVHGGGFAGTTLNIVKNEDLQNFIDKMSAYYKKEDIIPLKVRSCGTIVL